MTTLTLTRGTLTDDELAALTVVLLARLGNRPGAETEPGRAGVVVRLRGRLSPDYSSPRSWQAAA